MKHYKLICVCFMAFLLFAGCGKEEKPKPSLQSFALTYCNEDKDCPTNFTCDPVYCSMKCEPDGKGGCLPCNKGKAGKCLPKPQNVCPSDCKEGVCGKICTGICDEKTMKCENVGCEFKCLPKGCETDTDCGKGKMCEKVCVAGSCDFATGKCAEEKEKCLGKCVDKPEPEKKCDKNEDCPNGFVCEPIYCALFCAPDGKGGCLPCNDGKLGVCVPEPQKGCKNDGDCKDGEKCEIVCVDICDEFAPDCGGGACIGECIPVEGCKTDAECPPNFICEQICEKGWLPCAAEEKGAKKGKCPGGNCFGQCIPKPPKPKKCNVDKDCPEGFVCEPVFCTMQCIPDGKGGCLPCNDGFLGICVQKPVEGCQSDADCLPEEKCEIYCTGLCDPTFGCGDICKGICVPKEKGCETDADCADDEYCEVVCTKGCAPDSQKCIDGECFGICLKKKPEPKKCNEDKDCPEGFVCEPVFCTMQCIPDEKGGCLPCNDGYLGICVPKPVEGCQSDADCLPEEKCEIYCTGLCDSTFGCGDICNGVCVPKEKGCESDNDCAEDEYCEKVCPVCSEKSGSNSLPACGGECFGICLKKKPEPKKCNEDKDCPEGFVCEPVFCTMQCIPDEKGGCLPCNDGFLGICVPKPVEGCQSDADCLPEEKCEIYCTGLCDPTFGCGDICKGICVPKEKGCESDNDCAEDEYCEKVCPVCSEKSGSNSLPACGGECFGICLKKKPEPKKCNEDKDCPPSFVCEPVFCTIGCIPDEKGGCLPCNDGYLGFCVQKPVEGCLIDADCLPEEKCEVYCTGLCDPTFGCGDICKGVCVSKGKGCENDDDCAENEHCEVVCTEGCAPDSQKCIDDGGCFGICVPEEKECKEDKDCPPGFQCVFVSCVDIEDCIGGGGVCVPKSEGCKENKDCKEDEVCQLECDKSCGPYGCEEKCKGTCVEAPYVCACPLIYKPVCGKDGKTYGNACEAICAKVEIEHEGPCESECKTDKDCDDANENTEDICLLGVCINLPSQ